jgi:hypothetical protein
VKVGGQAQFGYLPRMSLANIDAMNAESFCERILSCAGLVVTDLHTSLDHDEVRMLTMLRMNKYRLEYMRNEYDNLHSHIEASKTRISTELRDKAEVQAQETAVIHRIRLCTVMWCIVFPAHLSSRCSLVSSDTCLDLVFDSVCELSLSLLQSF